MLTEVPHFEEAHLIWTQWRKNNHISLLDTKYEVTKKEMLDLAKEYNKDRIPKRPENISEYDENDPLKAS